MVSALSFCSQGEPDAHAACFERDIEIEAGKLLPGSTARRSPDTTKLQALGFTPVTSIETGISKTVAWYRNPVYA